MMVSRTFPQEIMSSIAISYALVVQTAKASIYDASALNESMIPIVDFSSETTFSTRYFLKNLARVSRPLPKYGTLIKVAVFYSFIAFVNAATDCEILNSGFAEISAAACCTETSGITCVNDRVTEM
jgi:hypothetical protein